VEQTTRGLTELASLPSIPLPVVNVAKSPIKQWEMPHIGEQVVAQVEALASQIGLGGVTQKPAVVMGYGPISEGLARALAARGAKVSIWDPDPKARERARKDGFDAPEVREQALMGKSVALGGSGFRSLTRDDLKLLAPGAVVGSASSRDLEVDLSPNHDQKVEVVPLLAQGRGDKRFITRVWRFEDRDVVVLKNGFPLNFTGGFETGSFDDIAPTRAAMLLAAAQALKETAPGLKPANVEAQRKVAQALGRELPA
jgi:adenosylhomocysteinase